jgi:hypothetical protein
MLKLLFFSLSSLLSGIIIQGSKGNFSTDELNPTHILMQAIQTPILANINSPFYVFSNKIILIIIIKKPLPK